MLRSNISPSLKAVTYLAFFLFFIVTISQTTPLWTRLALGRFSIAQHILVVVFCFLGFTILAAYGLNRIIVLVTLLFLPVLLTFVGYLQAPANDKIQQLANCADLLRLPAAALFGSIFYLVELRWQKVILILAVVSICAVNTSIAFIESRGNRYALEVSTDLVTTTDQALDRSTGMEDDIRPRAACITPNGLASVLSLGFLIVIACAVFQRESRFGSLAFTLLAFAIIAGIYWSTVRSALVPACLVLALTLATKRLFHSLSFRRAIYLATLAFAVFTTLGNSSFSSELEKLLRPYIGKLAASSSSQERGKHWEHIQSDIIQNPGIAFFGIDILGIKVGERKHQSGICDNTYYYFIFHWGLTGVLLAGYSAIFPFTKLFNDETYGTVLWLVAVFVVLAAAFTDEIYYLPAAFLTFLIGLVSTHQFIGAVNPDRMHAEQILT